MAENENDSVPAETVAAHEEQARRTAQDAVAHDSGSDPTPQAQADATGRLTPKLSKPQGDGDPGDERADSEDDGAGDPMRDERVGE